MKERSSSQFNRLVQIGLKFVSSNFQRVLTRILAVNRLNLLMLTNFGVFTCDVSIATVARL